MTTESQRYNCLTRNGGNAIPKHAGPEAKGSNPTAGLTLPSARNPSRGNFNHWQVSRKEAKYYSGNQIRKNEMGGACGMYGGEERCVQGFGGET